MLKSGVLSVQTFLNSNWASVLTEKQNIQLLHKAIENNLKMVLQKMKIKCK